MNTDEQYILRCFDLAILGAGKVSPNPMVGAVLVYQGRIIGEGYHQKYGGPHAEVNAVASVKPEDRHLIPESTLYVSLEPCCIHGRTPPCTGLILDQKIKEVVIASIDLTPTVKGEGVSILKNAGVQVKSGILKDKGEQLALIRNTFASQNRPYIILKYATSKNGKIAPDPAQQLWLSNAYSKRLTHKWRSEIDAILVGTNTALIDNPSLNNRHYYGKSPIRVLIDRTLKVDPQSNIFQGEISTLVFTNSAQPSAKKNIEHIQIDFKKSIIPPILKHLSQRKISSLMVEGGKALLDAFIHEKCWDEARVLETQKWIPKGLDVPELGMAPQKSLAIDNDTLNIFRAT